MLVIEIVSTKPLSQAQLRTAQLKTQQSLLKRQRADADVMRKREQLLKAQQRKAAIGNLA